MPTPYPIATIIAVAKACQSMARIGVIKGIAFNGGNVDQRLPKVLLAERKALELMYAYDPTESTLDTVANYVWALCAWYRTEALNAIGNGTGSVIIPNIQPQFNWQWVTNSFTVGMSGSPVANGASSFTITADNIAQDSVAFGFSNASPLPRTGTVPIGQATYSVTYSATAITITLSNPVATNDQYTLTYVRLGGTQSFNSSGTSLPDTTGHEGEVLFTDGAGNYYWSDATIDITSADFEADGKTVNDTSMLHNKLDIYLNELGRFLSTSEFTRIGSGGFVINLAGFNAGTTAYTLKVLLKGINA